MDLLISNQGLSHLALHILSYVDIKQDMINCKLVCKDWKDLIESSIRIWKRRLNFVYRYHDELYEYYKEFREAFATIQESNDLEKVKRFVLLLEKYVYVMSDNYHFWADSPIHWYARKDNGTSEDCMFFVNMVSSLNDPCLYFPKTVFRIACSSGDVELVRSLMEASKYKDIDLNLSFEQQLTGLMKATEKGHYEVVKLLFEKSREFHIDTSDFFKHACVSDSPQIFDLVLKKYESEGIQYQLNVPDEYGTTPFIRMCCDCHQSTNVIDYIIDRANELQIDFNQEADNFASGFMNACMHGNHYVVKKILEHCEQNDYFLQMDHSYNQLSVLQLACQGLEVVPGPKDEQRYKRTVEILLKHATRFAFEHLDVNKTDGSGRTALMMSALAGRGDLVELFIKYAVPCNINFNIRDYNGFNVLLMPTIKNMSGSLPILLQNVRRLGIEANTIIRKNRLYWNTSFHEFCACRNVKLLETLFVYSKNVIMDYNATDSKGRTGFIQACEEGLILNVQCLIVNSKKVGIDLNATEYYGMTGFMLACINRNARVLEILFAHSEDVLINYNAFDSNGQTGFMQACEEGLHLNVESLILNSKKVGIDLNATDDNWMTGYMLACKNRNVLVVETILQYSTEYDIDLKASDKQGRTGFDLWKLSKKIPFPTEDKYSAKRHLFYKKIRPLNFNSNDNEDEE